MYRHFMSYICINHKGTLKKNKYYNRANKKYYELHGGIYEYQSYWSKMFKLVE